MKGITNNCNYINDGLKAYIESFRDIPAGSEILVNYGKDYWDVVRSNIRIEKKERTEKAKKAKKSRAGK